MQSSDAHLREAAQAWLDADPDPETRAELQGLLDRADIAGLRDRFAEPLTFGTAGIRGALGAGPGRMNRVLVRRVTAGLAARLREERSEALRGGVVVGRDARHKSAAFADDVAAVLAGAGLAVHAFTAPVPTPLLAFAVRALGAAAGVQVTASHNPSTDNGYKIYWADGAQIVAPLDAEIAAAVDAVGPTGAIPLAAPGEVTPVPARVREEYVQAALAPTAAPDRRDLTIAYTPLHGVAGDLLMELLRRAGFQRVAVVERQSRPDPDFPTVGFPNPEEPGVLDMAVGLAVARDADLLLANDPDGDRIAAAVPTGNNGWRLLTGDEVGCLLADYLLAQGTDPARVVGTTVVSSQLLARIAAAYGVEYLETLTGFKWLAQAAAEARARGGRLVIAYEQALGVMIGDAVRDKDGMTAALVLAELAAVCRAAGGTLADSLDGLARRFGLHATAAHSVRLAQGRGLVTRTLERLRTAPLHEVAGVPVAAVSDHARGVRRLPDGTVERLTTPPTTLLSVELADGSRLQVRPSGTEPLLKFYFEVVEPVPGTDDGPDRARALADERLAALRDAFLAAGGLGSTLP